jgi:Ribonuclease G/E
VRVRGIYATAISKLLVNHGFTLVDVSEKIVERLGIEQDLSPSDVTVKTTEDPDEVLVVGHPRQSREVFEVLVSELKYVYTWKSPVDLHGVYLGIVREKRDELCIVDIGEASGTLYPCKENVGEKLVVGVKKPPIKPGERVMLTKNFRVVGNYIALVHGEPRITFSEHVRDAKTKARLSAIAASRLMGTGLGVHFRSSSKYASDDAILGEIDALLSEYKSLVNKAREESSSAPLKLRDGEFIAILSLTSLAKKTLDEVRRSVTPTIENHHSLKSMGLSDLVDAVEHVLSKSDQLAGTRVSLSEYIAKKALEAGSLEIIHLKPTGESLRLKPGELVSASARNGSIALVIKRVFESHGTYDGLGIEKKPGDVDYMVVDTSKPYITHNYYRSGNWLGTYVNINTPPEVSPGLVKYHDLLVDVVIYPSGEVKVIDVEELEEALSRGYLTRELYEYAMSVLEEVKKSPKTCVYNPYTGQYQSG